MKRLAAILLLVAAPLFAQAPNGWQELPNGWGEIQNVPVPTTCITAGMVPFLGSPVSGGMQCDAGLTYDAATDVLTNSTRIASKALTVSGLATPGSITVTPTLSKVGSITTVAGASLVDGDYFTIEYAAGLTVPIEFDATPGNGTTGGRVPYVFAPGDTADQIRDGLVTLLNTAAGTQLTASSGGAATVSLVLDTPGAAGGTNTENVAAAGFAVTGFVNPTAATTYTYRLVARLADGTTTEAGAASTTAAGHATLSASNFNALSWSAVTGATSYDVYRTVGGATQGKIASATTALSANDTGLAGGGESAPAINGTGVVTAGRVLAGNGTAAAPSFAFTAGSGLFRGTTTGAIVFSTGGYGRAKIGASSATAIQIEGASQLGWASTGGEVTDTTSSDLLLTRAAAATLQLGAANSATPVAQRLKVQDATGTNTASAAQLYIDGPNGTGHAAVGALVLRSGAVQASGATAHVPTTRMSLKEGHINIPGLPTYANNAAALAGGLVAGDLYTITGSDPLALAVTY